jgi:hypothetical protein
MDLIKLWLEKMGRLMYGLGNKKEEKIFVNN